MTIGMDPFHNYYYPNHNINLNDNQSNDSNASNHSNPNLLYFRLTLAFTIIPLLFPSFYISILSYRSYTSRFDSDRITFYSGIRRKLRPISNCVVAKNTDNNIFEPLI